MSNKIIKNERKCRYCQYIYIYKYLSKRKNNALLSAMKCFFGRFEICRMRFSLTRQRRVKWSKLSNYNSLVFIFKTFVDYNISMPLNIVEFSFVLAEWNVYFSKNYNSTSKRWKLFLFLFFFLWEIFINWNFEELLRRNIGRIKRRKCIGISAKYLTKSIVGPAKNTNSEFFLIYE